jgi:hypothetical protein
MRLSNYGTAYPSDRVSYDYAFVELCMRVTVCWCMLARLSASVRTGLSLRGATLTNLVLMCQMLPGSHRVHNLTRANLLSTIFTTLRPAQIARRRDPLLNILHSNMIRSLCFVKFVYRFRKFQYDALDYRRTLNKSHIISLRKTSVAGARK